MGNPFFSLEPLALSGRPDPDRRPLTEERDLGPGGVWLLQAARHARYWGGRAPIAREGLPRMTEKIGESGFQWAVSLVRRGLQEG